MRAGLQEIEIKSGLAAGGRIRNVFITAETVDGRALYRLYLRSSWSRHFLPLRSWADRSDRTYRELDRLITLVRDDFGFQDYIILYRADDPKLSRYRTVSAKRSNFPLKPKPNRV